MKDNDMRKAINTDCLPPVGSGGMVSTDQLMSEMHITRERKIQTLVEAALMASGYIAAKCGPSDPVLVGLVFAMDDLGVKCDYVQELAKLERDLRQRRTPPGLGRAP